MVIKTLACEYTEYRIYPGHGKKYISKDGKVHIFINRKANVMYSHHIRNVKLTWTQAWRRFHKKGREEEAKKKRQKRKVRIQKAYVGMDMAELKRRQNEKPAERQKMMEEAMKEVKDRKKKKLDQKLSKKQDKPKQIVKQPKKGGKAGRR